MFEYWSEKWPSIRYLPIWNGFVVEVHSCPTILHFNYTTDWLVLFWWPRPSWSRPSNFLDHRSNVTRSTNYPLTYSTHTVGFIRRSPSTTVFRGHRPPIVNRSHIRALTTRLPTDLADITPIINGFASFFSFKPFHFTYQGRWWYGPFKKCAYNSNSTGIYGVRTTMDECPTWCKP